MTDGWVGPAVVAAVVSAIVTGLGWIVGHERERAVEERRRRDKIVDMQKALRAEIRTRLDQLTESELEAHLAAMRARMAAEPDFFPFPPREAEDVVFTAMVETIDLLPTGSVEAVVSCYAQLGAVAAFAEDLRSDAFRALPKARRDDAYGHFIAMKVRAREKCEAALGALGREIGPPTPRPPVPRPPS